MFRERVRIAAVVEAVECEIVVRSPAIGWWDDGPAEGLLIGPGADLGTLITGATRRTLVLPEGAIGRVRLIHSRGRRGVGFDEPLLRLASAGVDALNTADAGSGSGPDASAQGTLAVVSPTDGVFYRRPAPDAPAFVEPGARVRRGQPVGLVEVMKTFNQVLYGADGLPEEAEVVELIAGDGQEVTAGERLVVVRGL